MSKYVKDILNNKKIFKLKFIFMYINYHFFEI